jgi:hypothetical protein
MSKLLSAIIGCMFLFGLIFYSYKADATTVNMTVRANNGPFATKTLTDIKAVFITVESFSNESKKAGFSEVWFKELMVNTLNDKGIRVLTQKEWEETKGYPYLYLAVTPTHLKSSDVAAYAVSVEFYQSAILEVADHRALVCTWSHAAIGLGDRSDVNRGVRQSLRSFIQSWESVNE